MKMKITKSEIICTVVRPDQYPEESVPEIALAGRSNVGKSSLINCLINRKNLARTSGQPGKTQTLNFYNINDEFRFVDLPGYGYARVSKTERDKWKKMIRTYIESRKSLLEIVLLLDIRHPPSENDIMMYDWIRSVGFNGIVVATKCDKINKGNYMKHIVAIQKYLKIENRDLIIPFSASKKINKEKILQVLDEVLEANK